MEAARLMDMMKLNLDRLYEPLCMLCHMVDGTFDPLWL